MNRWRIPRNLEKLIRDRDIACVYCGIELLESVPKGSSRKQVATWEHIINDATIVTVQNIARCCNSCNASKGTKNLRNWLDTNYCKLRGITADSVALVVREHLALTCDDDETGRSDEKT
jgi:hypothetical protein